MKIQEATAADLPAIVAIYNAAIPSQIVTADSQPVTVESRLDWFHNHTPTHYPLWVVKSGDEIMGWLGFQPFYGRPAYAITAELSVYVASGYQRQGVGRRLLEQAIAQSPALGIKVLLGLIFAANQPSLRLFQQFGFVQWGYLPAVAQFGYDRRDLIIVGLTL